MKTEDKILLIIGGITIFVIGKRCGYFNCMTDLANGKIDINEKEIILKIGKDCILTIFKKNK